MLFFWVRSWIFWWGGYARANIIGRCRQRPRIIAGVALRGWGKKEWQVRGESRGAMWSREDRLNWPNVLLAIGPFSCLSKDQQRPKHAKRSPIFSCSSVFLSFFPPFWPWQNGEASGSAGRRPRVRWARLWKARVLSFILTRFWGFLGEGGLVIAWSVKYLSGYDIRVFACGVVFCYTQSHFLPSNCHAQVHNCKLPPKCISAKHTAHLWGVFVWWYE